MRDRLGVSLSSWRRLLSRHRRTCPLRTALGDKWIRLRPVWSSSDRSWSQSRRLATSATLCPRWARPLANSVPMPEDAPAMTTCEPGLGFGRLTSESQVWRRRTHADSEWRAPARHPSPRLNQRTPWIPDYGRCPWSPESTNPRTPPPARSPDWAAGVGRRLPHTPHSRAFTSRARWSLAVTNHAQLDAVRVLVDEVSFDSPATYTSHVSLLQE